LDRISVIVPVYNEAAFISKTIESFQGFDCEGFEVDFLFVDGISKDGTREKILEYHKTDKRVQLLDNPKQKTPYAMNIGLQNAKGNYVAILGAHSRYANDYLKTCLQELKNKGSVGCSGRVIIKPYNTRFSTIIPYWIVNSAFGVSGSSFRTQKEGFADTLPYAVFIKDALVKAGGYNELLHRNQDNDMNRRLVEAGHKLYFTWKTSCEYYGPQDIGALYKYAYKNGFWNAISVYINRSSMSFRHLIPSIFVAGIIALLLAIVLSAVLGSHLLLIIAIALLGLGIGSYFLTALAFSVNIAIKEKDLRALALPVYYFGFHFIYGLGTIIGLIKNRKMMSK
jgi:glycosyltransferase involved in cell wall biosynthesis